MFAMALLCLGLVDSADPSSADKTAYQEAAAKAGKDPSAQVKLALWCEAHGMNAERMKHLAAAVAQDPGHAVARGLMGLVARGGKWERPEDVSREVKDDPRLKALRDEYFQRRARTPDKADDQWRLARWCEQNGLKEEATAHYHAVLRLEPRRDSVWKHLGFKKAAGQWARPEQIEAKKRETEAQSRADRRWQPILERWRAGLASRDRERRAHAEEGLEGVTEARAVPMIWSIFARGKANDQQVAIRMLARIDSPGASRALAMLAIHGRTPELRRNAAEILRNRDPRDYLGLLVRMVRDPLKYEIRPGDEPNSPGQLFVEGRRYNIVRHYMISEEGNTFARLNNIPPRLFADGVPFDPTGYWESGLAMQAMMWNNPFGFVGAPVSAAPVNGSMPAPANARASAALRMIAKAVPAGGPPSPFVGSVPSAQALAAERDLVIAQRLALLNQVVELSRQQLRNDIQTVESYNADVRQVNGQVVPVLNYLTGVDIGGSGEDWQAWWTDQQGYAYTSPDTSEKPTYENIVMNPFVLPGHSCFAAGTLVRTLEGTKAIETIWSGDQVLSQDVRTGALNYLPVVAVYHNKPAATYRISLEGQEIVATGIHRLWKAGKGWTMTRDLKPGDVLRTLSGIAPIQSVDPDRVQPVFNLKVSDGNSYFVGEVSVLAHDNSPVEPVAEPFDAVRPIDVVTAPATPTPAASPKPATSGHHRSMLGH